MSDAWSAYLDLAVLPASALAWGKHERCSTRDHTPAAFLLHEAGVQSIGSPCNSLQTEQLPSLLLLRVNATTAAAAAAIIAGFPAGAVTMVVRLQAEGFSEAIIDRFFRPFLGGIFFNTQLTTSSRCWGATPGKEQQGWLSC